MVLGVLEYLVVFSHFSAKSSNKKVLASGFCQLKKLKDSKLAKSFNLIVFFFRNLS